MPNYRKYIFWFASSARRKKFLSIHAVPSPPLWFMRVTMPSARQYFGQNFFYFVTSSLLVWARSIAAVCRWCLCFVSPHTITTAIFRTIQCFVINLCVWNVTFVLFLHNNYIGMGMLVPVMTLLHISLRWIHSGWCVSFSARALNQLWRCRLCVCGRRLSAWMSTVLSLSARAWAASSRSGTRRRANAGPPSSEAGAPLAFLRVRHQSAI